ncbi:hypothetical protein GCM10010211_76090 [Streptomyces albospinus]|uniref:Uncharacterized protein n=1 Tax=Streptomyces albospinus TaxID=285515 RepID=A0ABQ2VMG9_9ACTN|nr:hypothetical protein GCM10010211_76090 [Streptomyces albospinus]
MEVNKTVTRQLQGVCVWEGQRHPQSAAAPSDPSSASLRTRWAPAGHPRRRPYKR